jgi:hypothetical protein
MDEATDNYDAPEKRTLRIAGLCICVFAASLGLISLGAGLHRVSLTQTCASAAGACLMAGPMAGAARISDAEAREDRVAQSAQLLL